jgi:glycosyltransferase involved in cell wall biosynthesis
MIDVVMANFNHAKSIGDSINALNKQTLKPQKIIIVDDASTDDSLKVIGKLQEKHTNIQLVQNTQNLGATNSYNIGLRHSKNQFIYFAAADDLTYPELFSRSVAALENSQKAAFACSEVHVVDQTSGRKSNRPIIRPRIRNEYMKPEEVSREFRTNDNWIMTGATVFRRELISLLDGFDPRIDAFSDSILAKKLAFKYGCVFLTFYGSEWHISKNGLSRSVFSQDDLLDSVKDKIKFTIENDGNFPAWYWSKYSKRLDFSRTRLSYEHEPIEFVPKSKLKITSLVNKILFKSRKIVFTQIAFIRNTPFSFFRYLTTSMARKINKN